MAGSYYEELDNRRSYRALRKRGHKTADKYISKGVPSTKGPAKMKKNPPVKQIQLDLFKKKAGGYTVTNRFSDIMLPEKKKTTRIT